MFNIFDKDGILIGTVEEAGSLGCGGWLALIALGIFMIIMLLVVIQTMWWMLILQVMGSLLVSWLFTMLMRKHMRDSTVSTLSGTICFIGNMVSSYFLVLRGLGDEIGILAVAVWIWLILSAYLFSSLGALLSGHVYVYMNK